MKARIKPQFERLIGWSYPDLPRRPLCALCHGGPLPELPLLAWRDNGACVALCDICCEEVLEVVE